MIRIRLKIRIQACLSDFHLLEDLYEGEYPIHFSRKDTPWGSSPPPSPVYVSLFVEYNGDNIAKIDFSCVKGRDIRASLPLKRDKIVISLPALSTFSKRFSLLVINKLKKKRIVFFLWTNNDTRIKKDIIYKYKTNVGATRR